VSQRLRIKDEQVMAIVGRPHGAPLPARTSQSVSRGMPSAGRPKAPCTGVEDSEQKQGDTSESEGEEERQQNLFPVPLLEYDMPPESVLIRQVYSFVDRLSYLDWGLRSEDAVQEHPKRRPNPLASARRAVFNP